MSYGNLNVDTVTTSTPNGILGAGNASIMKNRLINSDMRIDQRNAGASVTPNNSYTLDRWSTENSQTGKFTVQQTTTAPTGFSNSLKVTSSSAYTVLTGDYFALFQNIEGYNTADLAWGTASAKTVTLSFQIYSSLTGTFGGALSNSAGNRSYPFTYTVSSANTWTSISVTIAGDTSGTWGTTNGIGIQVQFGLGVGSTYSGTAGAWASALYVSATGATSVVGTNGATFYITGVQLEVGSSATGFEYVNYQTSLANCQRYFYTLASGAGTYFSVGYNYDAATMTSVVPFPVTMRTAPSLSSTSGTGWYAFYRNGANDAFNSLTIIASGLNSSGITNNTQISGTAGNAGGLYTDNAGCFIAFSAEL